LRQRESGGTPDPCLRCVYSRIRSSNGAGEVEVAASFWNKVLEVDLHLGGASRSVVGVLPALVPPGSSDLVRLAAPGLVFMAELKTGHGSFCPSFPSPTRWGFSWPGRGDAGGGVVWSWCLPPAPSVACTGVDHGGSSPLLLLGRGGDRAPAVRHLSASSSCGCAIAEVDDFPLADAGCCPRSGRRGCGGAGALTARLRPVSMFPESWVPRDWNVISTFSGVLCTAVSF
jgi:hypothetical protein